MNKDALFATLIGLAIGIAITGIVLVGPNIAKSLPKIPAISIPKFSVPNLTFMKKKPAPSPTGSTQQSVHTVVIDSPLDQSIESDKKIFVSGTTTKESTIVVSGLVDEAVVTTNGDGKYAGEVTLSEGKNDIVVTSYKDGIKTEAHVFVYYTPSEW
jgi:hypothetical protein